MSHFLELVQLNPLLATTEGRSEIVIGLIDGQVESSHPDLLGANLQTIATSGLGCEASHSLACFHGTFIAGILVAKRGSQAPAICPGCQLLIRPIFCEVTSQRPSCPEVNPTELAQAIRETIAAGANIINLSMGLSTVALLDMPELMTALNYAYRKGVLLVVATGNQGRIGQVPLFNHHWVIPVVACDREGRMEVNSNIGPSIGRRGLMAPGTGVVSISTNSGYTNSHGTSVAVPFVTGTLALLWSLFPNATAAEMRRAILLPGQVRKTINPPLLNAQASWRALTVSS